MKDNQLINDIVGTMTKFGHNCDRSTLGQRIFMVLSDLQELDERLKGIQKLADMSFPPPALQKALIALDA